MTQPAKDYYQLTCPHCQQQMCIRLHAGESVESRCKCNRQRVAVTWQNGQVVATKAESVQCVSDAA